MHHGGSVKAACRGRMTPGGLCLDGNPKTEIPMDTSTTANRGNVQGSVYVDGWLVGGNGERLEHKMGLWYPILLPK